MSENFEWRTEDDDFWNQAEPVSPREPQGKGKPWWAIGLFAGLLLLAAVAAYWQISQRLDAAAVSVEMDVISTHNLITKAVAAQDAELIAPLLSGRDLPWTRAYEELLEAGLFYDRSQFGLSLAESVTPLHLSPDDQNFVELELSPDMNSAELSYLESYNVGGGERVSLLQTTVYRRGSTRWLMAPPDAEFWGGWDTLETPHITFVFPKRDGEVVSRLAADLAGVLTAACVRYDTLDCDDALQLHFRFETDPQSLMEASLTETLYDGNARFSLPTPTLVGLPQDDDGYEALRVAYGSSMIAVALSTAVEWECCRHAAIYQVLMEHELNQLGLGPWPVTTETHSDAISTGTNLDTIFSFWLERSIDSLDQEDAWQVYAFVDFLLQQYPSLEGEDLMRSLAVPVTFERWLSGVFGGEREQGVVISERLAHDWWLYAHQQVLDSQGPRPIPFPDQELLLTCVQDLTETPTSALYRYQLGDDSWRAETTAEGFMFVTPLANDEAMILQTISFLEESWQIQLWQDGFGLPISQSDQSTLSWGESDPNQAYLLVYRSDTADNAQPLPALTSLESCREGACVTTDVAGIPTWSPDGRQLLLSSSGFLENGLLQSADNRISLFDSGLYFNNLPLARGAPDILEDGSLGFDNLTEIGEGSFPFWLDDETYGFVHSNSSSPQEASQVILIASVNDDDPEIVLHSADLLEVLPEENRPFRLSIRYVLPHPVDSDIMIVMATSRINNYLFLVDIRNDIVEKRLDFVTRGYHFLGFSPDGRYLVATGEPEEDFRGPSDVTIFYLHDIVRNETRTFIAGTPFLIPTYAFDWSADGKWLAIILNNGTINLIAPEHDYQHLIRHDFGDCSAIAWAGALSR